MIILCPFTCADGDALLTRTGRGQPQATISAMHKLAGKVYAQ
jgi:hypothetical protein